MSVLASETTTEGSTGPARRPDPTVVVPVSVVVLAKNEAANLPRCLDSLRFSSDVVVIDDFSEDDTVEVARGHGARVFQHRFQSFADQRNFAADHADLRHDWVLHVDADEVIPLELAREIGSRLSASTEGVAAFLLCGKLMFLGKWLKHSASFPVWMPRLLHRGRTRYVTSGHGEKFGPTDGEVLKIDVPYLHYNFSKGIHDWIAKHNKYATDEAEATIADLAVGRVRWSDVFSGDSYRRRQALRSLARRMPLRPAVKFLYLFFVKMAFLDGRAGVTYAAMQSMYEYMIVLKVREMERRAAGESV